MVGLFDPGGQNLRIRHRGESTSGLRGRQSPGPNTIADCGTSAICGHSIVNGVIEENVIDHCAWQDNELWYDNGGMKLLVCANLLVRHNRNPFDEPNSSPGSARHLGATISQQ